MNSISEEKAKKYGICTVMSAFLAVFCLFGYRSSFSIMQGLIIADTGWSTIQTSLGYCIMMTIYAITAFFSGGLVDKKGTRPTYFIGAICCFLGFFLTSIFVKPGSDSAYIVYLFTYGILMPPKSSAVWWHGAKAEWMNACFGCLPESAVTAWIGPLTLPANTTPM